MVRELNDNQQHNQNIEKILVCITVQCNSKRLISQGAVIADKHDGELHIIHVQKGNNIFNNEETPKLLDELFDYGSKLGAMIHFYSNEDVFQCIGDFVENQKITKLVFGQPPTENVEQEEKANNVFSYLANNIDLIVVPREDQHPNIWLKRN